MPKLKGFSSRSFISFWYVYLASIGLNCASRVFRYASRIKKDAAVINMIIRKRKYLKRSESSLPEHIFSYLMNRLYAEPHFLQ